MNTRIRTGTMTAADHEADALLDTFDLCWGASEWSKEDVAKLRLIWPEAWDEWIVGQDTHRKRCPSCGDKVVRVGSTFRIPKQKDERAWRKVEKMIEEGEDMVAKFSYCMTFEEHDRAMEELADAIAEGTIPPP
jgi:hypothetical protein